jgi:hypothetical protein
MNLTRRHPAALALAQRLGRPVQLRAVDSWEGLAESLAYGETDIVLMGPWGHLPFPLHKATPCTLQ